MLIGFVLIMSVFLYLYLYKTDFHIYTETQQLTRIQDSTTNPDRLYLAEITFRYIL